MRRGPRRHRPLPALRSPAPPGKNAGKKRPAFPPVRRQSCNELRAAVGQCRRTPEPRPPAPPLPPRPPSHAFDSCVARRSLGPARVGPLPDADLAAPVRLRAPAPTTASEETVVRAATRDASRQDFGDGAMPGGPPCGRPPRITPTFALPIQVASKAQQTADCQLSILLRPKKQPIFPHRAFGVQRLRHAAPPDA